VPAAEAVALVHLEGHPRRRVAERRPEGIGPGGVAEERGAAGGRPVRGQVGEPPVLGERAARNDRAEGVEQHELGRVNRGSGQGVEARRGDEGREPIQIIHGRARQATAPAIGGVGPRRGRKRP